jgi:hypothetical protein
MIILCLLACSAAFAGPIDTPMQAEYPQFTVWAFLLTIAIELPFVQAVTGLPNLRALGAVLAINVASAFAGFIPGYFERFTAALQGFPYNIDKFGVAGWFALIFGALLLNTLVEGGVLRLGFRQRLGLRGVAWLFLANTLSLAVILCMIASCSAKGLEH